jgi:Flp pilus assembly protein TadG
VITTRFVRTVCTVVVVALVAVIALEVHWSMDAKKDARTDASAVAAAAAHELATSHDSLQARHVAELRAAAARASLVAFTITDTGSVVVTLNRRSKSYILRRLPPTRSVTEITVSATAAPQ